MQTFEKYLKQKEEEKQYFRRSVCLSCHTPLQEGEYRTCIRCDQYDQDNRFQEYYEFIERNSQ